MDKPANSNPKHNEELVDWTWMISEKEGMKRNTVNKSKRYGIGLMIKPYGD